MPASSVICIDLVDWLRQYNIRADDGVSWVDGKPARSLYLSWRDLMAKLGPMMHAADKVIHPGEEQWKPLKGNEQGVQLALDVPLARGCAMLKLKAIRLVAGDADDGIDADHADWGNAGFLSTD